MNANELKRTLLRVFIGFLVLTAAIAIVSVVSGEFGELQVKILLTTVTISAASICAMAGAAFIELRQQRALGLIGIICSALAACLTIGGVWGEVSDDGYWRSTLIAITIAVALAHGFLLAIPRLNPSHRWVSLAGVASVGTLAGQVILIIAEINLDAFSWRALSVNAIVVVLLTLVLPILMRMRQPVEGEQLMTLRLKRQYGNVFADGDGALYQVIPKSEWSVQDDSEVED